MNQDTGAGEPRGTHRSGAGLGRRAVSGLAWSSLGVGGRAVLRIAVLAVLARLVTPAEFGQVTAVLVVVSMSSILAEVGLGPAIIQRAELTEDHLRAAWTMLVLTGAGLWLVVAWSAPAVAALFNMQGLEPLLRVMASVFFIRNLTVSDFLLSREMRFATIAKVDMLAYLVGYGGFTIVLAALGFGAWAIAAGTIGEITFRVAAMYRIRPHSLRPLFAWAPTRDLLGFGGGNTLSRSGQLVAHQADNVIVGHSLGAAALGMYGRAYQLMAMPAQLFLTMLTRVLFPLMSSLHNQVARLRALYLNAVSALALVIIPLSVIAAIMSRELVLALLGPDWLALHTAFSVMVLGMFFRAAPGLADCVSMATGAVYRQAWRKWAYAGAIIAGATVGRAWGISGVAVGVLVAMVANTLVQTHLSLVLVSATWGQLAAALRPALLAAVVAGGPTALVARTLRGAGAPSVVVLLSASAVAAVVLVVLGRLAPRLPGGDSLARLLRVVRRLARDTRYDRSVDRALGAAYRPAMPARIPEQVAS